MYKSKSMHLRYMLSKWFISFIENYGKAFEKLSVSNDSSSQILLARINAKKTIFLQFKEVSLYSSFMINLSTYIKQITTTSFSIFEVIIIFLQKFKIFDEDGFYLNRGSLDYSLK